MDNNRLEPLKTAFHQSLTCMQAALSMPLDEDGIVCDALFHRFRLTFDLSEKLLKAILDYEGIEAASPRSAIREAWKLHLIMDAEKWLDMQQKRNLTAHTYNESTAREIYRLVKEEYYSLLEELDQRME